MHLSKSEEKFIIEYLIGNKVNYWNMRMELLGHMAMAVEKKMC